MKKKIMILVLLTLVMLTPGPVVAQEEFEMGLQFSDVEIVEEEYYINFMFTVNWYDIYAEVVVNEGWRETLRIQGPSDTRAYFVIAKDFVDIDGNVSIFTSVWNATRLIETGSQDSFFETPDFTFVVNYSIPLSIDTNWDNDSIIIWEDSPPEVAQPPTEPDLFDDPGERFWLGVCCIGTIIVGILFGYVLGLPNETRAERRRRRADERYNKRTKKTGLIGGADTKRVKRELAKYSEKEDHRKTYKRLSHECREMRKLKEQHEYALQMLQQGSSRQKKEAMKHLCEIKMEHERMIENGRTLSCARLAEMRKELIEMEFDIPEEIE